MRVLAPILISAILATGGCVATGGDMGGKSAVNDDHEIRTIGKPKSCITSFNIRSTDVIDDQTIDFRMNNGDIYRNRLPNRCSGLGFEEAFSYETSTSQLCSVDIIHVLDRVGGRIEPGVACGLGKFQQIEKIKR